MTCDLKNHISYEKYNGINEADNSKINNYIFNYFLHNILVQPSVFYLNPFLKIIISQGPERGWDCRDWYSGNLRQGSEFTSGTGWYKVRLLNVYFS